MKTRITVILLVLLTLSLTTTSFAQDDEETLRIMHWAPALSGDEEAHMWWNEAIAAFEEAHPGVTIENNYIPFGQYLPALEAMIAGDELPDVFFGHVKVAELGRAGLTVNFSEIMDEEFLSQFYPGPMRQFTFDGNVYALPWTSQMFGIYVNPAIMEEVGVEPPETWDDLVEISGPLNEAGYIPLAWGNANMNVCTDFALPLVQQYDGNVYALDELIDPEVSWDSEPVIQAFELLKRLQDENVLIPGINGVDEAQGAQIFYQGRAAMLYGGSWYPSIIANEAPEELVESFYVWKNPALTEDSIHWSGNGSGEGWVVANNTERTDLALEFLQFILSDEVYLPHIEATQNMPSLGSAQEVLEDEFVREMTGWLETDGANHILFGQGSWEAFSGACASVLDGSLTPAEAAAAIQAEVIEIRER
ncbi:MAG: extracellular solute-binding protein [Aggregatilineales bacterium]